MKRSRGSTNNRYSLINYNSSSDTDLKRKVPKIQSNKTKILRVDIPDSRSIQNLTVDLVKDLFQKFGKINKIQIQRFKNSEMFVYIEFDESNSAYDALNALNGKLVFDKSLKLNIKYASKDYKLTIDKNDEYNWDFTKRISQVPVNAVQEGPKNFYDFPTIPAYQNYSEQPRFPMDQQYNPFQPGFQRYHINPNFQNGFQVPSLMFAQTPNHILLVKNIDPGYFNTCCMFNLFCLYGNVVKVKFLDYEKSVLVEMNNIEAAQRCITFLNGYRIGAMAQLHIGFSETKVVFPGSIFRLPDQSFSFHDFTLSKLNRFKSFVPASGYKYYAPNNVLYFYNAPSVVDKMMIANIFACNGIRFTEIVIFNSRQKPFSSGLIEFPTVEEAILAVVFCNHFDIFAKGHSAHPYTLKLNFTDRLIFRKRVKDPQQFPSPHKLYLNRKFF